MGPDKVVELAGHVRRHAGHIALSGWGIMEVIHASPVRSADMLSADPPPSSISGGVASAPFPPLSLERETATAPPPIEITIDIDQATTEQSAILTTAAAWGIEKNPQEQKLWQDFWTANPFGSQYIPTPENDLATRRIAADYYNSLMEVLRASANPVFRRDYEIQDEFRRTGLLRLQFKSELSNPNASPQAIASTIFNPVDSGLSFNLEINSFALSRRAASLGPVLELTQALITTNTLKDIYDQISQLFPNLSPREQANKMSELLTPDERRRMLAYVFGQEATAFIISSGQGLQIDEEIARRKAYLFVVNKADASSPGWINAVNSNIN